MYLMEKAILQEKRNRSHKRKVEDRDRTHVTFIDLTKGFDLVDRNLLIQKMLEEKEIPIQITQVIARIFAIASVDVNGLIKTHRGVLQGGVCSPSLFNIYVNSLIPILKATGAEVLLYADDLVLVTKSRL